MTPHVETPEERLKRLRIRGWRRGTKEMDLILGPYCDALLEGRAQWRRTTTTSIFGFQGLRLAPRGFRPWSASCAVSTIYRSNAERRRHR